MSEKKEYVKQYNAITYLYDFINTYLPLTYEEQRVIDLRQYGEDYTRLSPNQDWHLNKELRAQGLALCKGCGEILPVEEFYFRNRFCKKCYNEKVRKRKNDNNKL